LKRIEEDFECLDFGERRLLFKTFSALPKSGSTEPIRSTFRELLENTEENMISGIRLGEIKSLILIEWEN